MISMGHVPMIRYSKFTLKIKNTDKNNKKISKTVIETSKQVENSSASYNNQFKKKNKNSHKFEMQNTEYKCIICGNINCKQATDHIRMTFQQFDQKLRSKAGYQPNIAKLKNKIRKCYQKMQENINCQENLEPFVVDLFLMIDKLHFWHLLRFTDSLNDIEAAIFSVPLPKNRMIKLINILEQEPNYECSFPKFDKLFSETYKFKKSMKKIIQNRLYDELVFKLADIIKQCEQQFVQERSFGFLNDENKENQGYHQNQCMSQMGKKGKKKSSPGMPTVRNQELLQSEIVMVQEVPFSTKRRNIDLSILEFTDNTFFRCYNSLQKMQQVVELQLRNNRLSQQSYRILLKCFPNLETLDISNSNCQSFFKALSHLSNSAQHPLQNLKTLYLNESTLTDENLKKIPQYFPKLRVLYADYNLITISGIEEIYAQKKQLVYFSVKGNFVEEVQAQRLQVNMILHGGYLEY